MKYSALLIMVLFASLLSAQTVVKTFDQSYTKVDEVSFKQSRGPLTISPSTDGKIRVVTEMSVEAESEEDGAAFLTKMAAEVLETGNRISIKTGMARIKNWTQKNRSLKVVFQDGTKFSRMRNFESSSTLYLPAIELLKLETKFERVQIDPKVKLKDLELELHNAKLRGGNISGNLEMDVRFGEVELGDIGGNITGTLHNAQGEFGDAEDVHLEAHFSKFRMGILKSLDMDSNNSRLEAKSVTGSVEIEDGFGTYILGRIGNARIDTNNGIFEIENGGTYEIRGSFGNFDFGRVDNLIMLRNQNCDYDIDELGSVTGSASFTTINAEHLGQKAELKLENGHLKVDAVSSQFRGVEVEGAFFEVKLNFRETSNYRVMVDFNFGSVRLPDELVTIKKIKEYSDLEMELKTPNAAADSPVIKAKGQNGKLYID